MIKLTRFLGVVSLATAAVIGFAAQSLAPPVRAAGTESFEVSGIKAVRPNLVNTIAALKAGDHAGAKAAFEAYDSAWNGIEVYINTRDKNMYSELEQNYQARIAKALDSPDPDKNALLADAQAMLAKYDEVIRAVEKAPPLNPLYDDVARLRIVRASLREVTPAVKAGNMGKARKSFSAFDGKWDSIEDLIKARSPEAYTDIEKGMIQIERALMPDKPDPDQVTALVKGVMDKYNAIVAEITKEARGR